MFFEECNSSEECFVLSVPFFSSLFYKTPTMLFKRFFYLFSPLHNSFFPVNIIIIIIINLVNSNP